MRRLNDISVEACAAGLQILAGKRVNEEINFLDLEGKAPHPITGRYRVRMPVTRWPRGTEPKDDVFRYRAFSDEAAEAALKLADSSEERSYKLLDYRVKLTSINLALVGAIVIFLVGEQLSDGEINQTQCLGAYLILLLAALVFGMAIKQIGSQEFYYFTLSSEYRNIAQRHYGFRFSHWRADQKYQRDISRSGNSLRKGLFDAHSYRLMLWVNILCPMGGALAIAAALGMSGG